MLRAAAQVFVWSLVAAENSTHVKLHANLTTILHPTDLYQSCTRAEISNRGQQLKNYGNRQLLKC